MIRSGQNPHHIALRQLVEKKTDRLINLLREYHKRMPPEKSGPIHLANAQRIDDIIQSKCIAENRRLMMMSTEALNANYLNYASLHPNSALAPSSSHVFNQPAPQQTFHPPESVSSYQGNAQNVRERNKVTKPFANILDNKQTNMMEDNVRIGLSEKENLVLPESETESDTGSDEDVPIKKVPKRGRPKKNLTKRINANTKNTIPTRTSKFESEAEGIPVSDKNSKSEGTKTQPQKKKSLARKNKGTKLKPQKMMSTEALNANYLNYASLHPNSALAPSSSHVFNQPAPQQTFHPPESVSSYQGNAQNVRERNKVTKPFANILDNKQTNMMEDNVRIGLSEKENLVLPESETESDTGSDEDVPIKKVPKRGRPKKNLTKRINANTKNTIPTRTSKFESEAEGIPVSDKNSKSEGTKTQPQKKKSLARKNKGTKLKPQKEKLKIQEDPEMGRRTKSQPQKKIAQDDPVRGGTRIEPQKNNTLTQEDPKKETKTNTQQKKLPTHEGSKSKGTISKVHKGKPHYSKNRVNKMKIEQELMVMKKNVFDEMMTNNSTTCTSMSPNVLLKSINNNDAYKLGYTHTPHANLLNVHKEQQSNESSENDSGDDFILPKGTVGRLAKVIRTDKQFQRPPKPNPKTKIQTNLCDLPSIIDEDSD